LENFQANKQDKKISKIAFAGTVLIMDLDLFADLASIPKLVKETRDSGAVVIGQRSIPDRFTHVLLGVVVVLSLGYNIIMRLLFQTGLSDHQCGLKTMRTDVARRLVPKIKSNSYVFDTELIVAARKSGVPVRQVQVKWTDNRPRKSNLKWVRTSFTMMKYIFMLKACGL
jgi:hypothetical protein